MSIPSECNGCCYRRTCNHTYEKCCYLVGRKCVIKQYKKE